MEWKQMLREAIDRPETGLNPEKVCLYYQLTALRCCYAFENIDTSAIDQRYWTLFLALIVHLYIQPYLPFFTSVCLPLILLLPFIFRNVEHIPSYVIMVVACTTYPVFDTVVNWWLFIDSANYIMRALDTDAFLETLIWNMVKWYLLAMLHLLFIYEWVNFFITLMCLISAYILIRPVHGRLDRVFFVVNFFWGFLRKCI